MPTISCRVATQSTPPPDRIVTAQRAAERETCFTLHLRAWSRTIRRPEKAKTAALMMPRTYPMPASGGLARAIAASVYARVASIRPPCDPGPVLLLMGCLRDGLAQLFAQRARAQAPSRKKPPSYIVA